MRVLRRRRCLIALGLLLAAVGFASASDWPAFRGEGGTGVSDDKGLPTAWSKTENVRWKVDLPGRGLSNPIISGGKVFVTASSGANQDRLHVLCYDVKAGKKLWERQFWATGSTMTHPKTSVAAPTPVTDGKLVYALFSSGDLVCLDVEGNLVWYRALERDYPAVHNQLGLAASPVLSKETLLLPLENAGDSFVCGVDKLTGKNRWKTERKRDINWVSPFLMEHDGKQVVLFQSADQLTAFDPDKGKVVWNWKGGGLQTIPSPVPGKGIILVAGDGGVTALRPVTDKETPEVLWSNNKLSTVTPSPLFYDGKVYAINSGGVLNCADAVSGKILWSVRVGSKPYSASPVAGDGKIYTVNEIGVTYVVQTGDEGKVLESNDLGETILATPAIADGAIFLRSDAHLWCIAQKK